MPALVAGISVSDAASRQRRMWSDKSSPADLRTWRRYVGIPARESYIDGVGFFCPGSVFGTAQGWAPMATPWAKRCGQDRWSIPTSRGFCHPASWM